MVCLVVALIPVSTMAEQFTARVIWVTDGDTVLVVRNCAGNRPGTAANQRRTPCRGAQKIKIRLADIDAPEKAQNYGMASRDSLMAMVLHKEVQVNALALDKYQRTVALLKVDGLNVNEEQVRQGMAWEYSHYHSDRHYIALQQEARRAGRGLWAQPNPTPPWQWRSRHVTGEASRLRERPPAAQPDAKGLQQGDIGRRKQHAAEKDTPPVLQPGDYTCGSKHRCSQMRSCNEAHYYLTVCGVTALNPEGDGVPCKNLCGN